MLPKIVDKARPLTEYTTCYANVKIVLASYANQEFVVMDQLLQLLRARAVPIRPCVQPQLSLQIHLVHASLGSFQQ